MGRRMLGRTVAILASGPSMTPEIVEMVRKRTEVYSIVINETRRLMPDADMLFAGDPVYWTAYTDAASFVGRKVASRPDNLPRGVEFAPPRPPKEGGNSAMRACHLACDEGAAEILLFGVDLRLDAVTHWHGAHHHTLHNANAHTFRRSLSAWCAFAGQSDPRPPIFNCNPDSGLDCFPKVNPARAFQ